jgi:hypothetical protein
MTTINLNCERLCLLGKGSMLPCAGVTAWNALDGLKHIPKRASALLQGS